MLRLLRKSRQATSLVDEPIEIEKVVDDFDYMQFFFSNIKGYSETASTIEQNLSQLSDVELKIIAVTALQVTFKFIRAFSDYGHAKNSLKRNLSYKDAMLWHLSDAVHNIPSHLDEPESLKSYLKEFFEFIDNFEKLVAIRGMNVSIEESWLLRFRSEIRKSTHELG